MSRADRGHGKATIGRLSRDALDRQALRQAANELAAADACLEIAESMAAGSVGQRMQRDEAKRHRELAVRFLLELDR